MFRILANFLLARENCSRQDAVCRVWLRDVLPSMNDVEPDAALQRQYLAAIRLALSSISWSMSGGFHAGPVLLKRAQSECARSTAAVRPAWVSFLREKHAALERVSREMVLVLCAQLEVSGRLSSALREKKPRAIVQRRLYCDSCVGSRLRGLACMKFQLRFISTGY